VLHLFDCGTGALLQRIEQPHVQELRVHERMLVATTQDGRIASFSLLR
jgi:hypothetical protein